MKEARVKTLKGIMGKAETMAETVELLMEAEESKNYDGCLECCLWLKKANVLLLAAGEAIGKALYGDSNKQIDGQISFPEDEDEDDGV